MSWTEKGERLALTTAPANRPLAEAAVIELYKRIGVKKPPGFVWCRSPRECYERGPFHGNVSLAQEIMDLRGKYRQRSYVLTDNTAGTQIGSLVQRTLDNAGQYRNHVFLKGNHDAPWFIHYIDDSPALRAFVELSIHANWVLPYKKVCFMSEKPVEVHIENNRIHNFDGPAVKYGDQFSVFAFANLLVPAHYAAQNVPAAEILKERNVDIRRELVRKIGVEKMMEELNANIVDRWNGYELLEVRETRLGFVPIYLKMVNPSTGETHIEGVPSSTRTCKEALSWRLGGIEWDPEVLT